MPLINGMYASVSEGSADDIQPPVVLIHGAGSNHLIWPAQLRRLPGMRVLAVDLPGHGRTAGSLLSTIEAYADQIINLLQALDTYRAVFVGHSMGAAVALTLALEYPQHVAGLGVISAGAALTPPLGLMEELANPLLAASGLKTFLRQAFSSKAKPAVLQAVEESMSAERSSLLAADWQLCRQFDIHDRLAEIQAPTWVACGADDRITPSTSAAVMAAKIQNARLQIVPDAGHMVVLEQPAALQEGLLDFLQRIKWLSPEYQLQLRWNQIERRS